MPRRRAFPPELSNVLEGRIALSSVAAAVGHRSGVVAAESQAAKAASTLPSDEELTTTYANGHAGNFVGIENVQDGDEGDGCVAVLLFRRRLVGGDLARNGLERLHGVQECRLSIRLQFGEIRSVETLSPTSASAKARPS